MVDIANSAIGPLQKSMTDVRGILNRFLKSNSCSFERRLDRELNAIYVSFGM